jgi:tight adherence protein C
LTPSIIAAIAFLSTTSLVLLVSFLVRDRRSRIDARLDSLGGQTRQGIDSGTLAQITQSTLSKIGSPLLPLEEEQRTRLKTELLKAGFYSPRAMIVFLGIKMLLMAFPVGLGVLAGILGLTSVSIGAKYGLLASVFGMIAPSFFLVYLKRKRQSRLRRSLPDALDVIVICMEGGLSLPAAFQRVVDELRTVHPDLAMEMTIVEREMKFGRTTGEALRHFGERADLEEVRSLASVIIQAEHYGTSLVSTLRAHSKTLRTLRILRAEEMAQKAAVKIVFPTLLCIFPAVFIVLAGPAAMQVIELMARMNSGK